MKVMVGLILAAVLIGVGLYALDLNRQAGERHARAVALHHAEFERRLEIETQYRATCQDRQDFAVLSPEQKRIAVSKCLADVDKEIANTKANMDNLEAQ